jgi:hypothetical protein
VCKAEDAAGYKYLPGEIVLSGLVYPYANGFFAGWNWRVMFCVMCNLLQMWLAGIVTKKMSTVWKTIGQAISIVGMFFVSDMWLLKNPEKEFTRNTIVGLLIVTFLLCASIMQFMKAGEEARAEKAKEEEEKEARKKEERKEAGLSDGDVVQRPLGSTGSKVDLASRPDRAGSTAGDA